jgi:hypothetical protein
MSTVHWRVREHIKPPLKLPGSNILEAYHQSRNQIRISYCRPTRHTLGISPSFTGRTQYHDDVSSSRSSWLVILDLGDLTKSFKRFSTITVITLLYLRPGRSSKCSESTCMLLPYTLKSHSMRSTLTTWLTEPAPTIS